jgi:hypothetical protein
VFLGAFRYVPPINTASVTYIGPRGCGSKLPAQAYWSCRGPPYAYKALLIQRICTPYADKHDIEDLSTVLKA